MPDFLALSTAIAASATFLSVLAIKKSISRYFVDAIKAQAGTIPALIGHFIVLAMFNESFCIKGNTVKAAAVTPAAVLPAIANKLLKPSIAGTVVRFILLTSFLYLAYSSFIPCLCSAGISPNFSLINFSRAVVELLFWLVTSCLMGALQDEIYTNSLN